MPDAKLGAGGWGGHYYRHYKGCNKSNVITIEIEL